MKRVCVLVSGGVDSGVLVADRLRKGEEVYPLYIRAGHLWERVELVWLKRLLRALASPRLKPLTVLDAPVSSLLDSHWSVSGRNVPSSGAAPVVYIPGRNLVLLSHAMLFCKIRRISALAFAILKGNPFPDAQPSFLKAMERAGTSGLNARIRILAPYRLKKKREVARLIPGFPLHLTFSCLKPRGLKPCRSCSKCVERASVPGRQI